MQWKSSLAAVEQGTTFTLHCLALWRGCGKWMRTKSRDWKPIYDERKVLTMWRLCYEQTEVTTELLIQSVGLSFTADKSQAVLRDDVHKNEKTPSLNRSPTWKAEPKAISSRKKKKVFFSVASEKLFLSLAVMNVNSPEGHSADLKQNTLQGIKRLHGSTISTHFHIFFNLKFPVNPATAAQACGK